MLYNLSHDLDTAELSPMLDMCGAVCAQATYTLILSSKSTGDQPREVLPGVGGGNLCCASTRISMNNNEN